MLSDREPVTARAWLAAHPTISIVSRSWQTIWRSRSKNLPHAVQVTDRWHLMENASRAFLDAVRKSMRQIRTGHRRDHDRSQAANSSRAPPQGYLRREETNAAILALSNSGIRARLAIAGSLYGR
nr:transposase [Bradyrhizobium brasilense]